MKFLSSILIASVASQDDAEGRRRGNKEKDAAAPAPVVDYGSFDSGASYGDYGFGDTYGSYGDSSYGSSYGTYGGADANSFGDYSFGDYEAGASVDGADFGAADSAVEAAVAGSVAASSSSSTAGRERPVVTQATRGGPTGSDVYAYCRKCYWLKAGDCYAKDMEFCDQDNSAPFFDTDDYSHRCLAILRMSRHGQIRIWTGCSTIQACTDMWEQNFVGTNKLLHQCKDSATAARFEQPSQCSFCHRLSNTNGDQSFPTSAGKLKLDAGDVDLATLFVSPGVGGNLATANTIPDGQLW